MAAIWQSFIHKTNNNLVTIMNNTAHSTLPTANKLLTHKPRHEMIDALRGFALLGICLVHCMEYFELYWVKQDPTALHNLIFFLFAGKAYAIFALMFGVSFFIIMDNQARKGMDFRYRFVWRLVILLVLGYVHTLLYLGDILSVLGVIGLSLLFVQRLSNRWLIALATLCLLQLPFYYQYYAALNHLPGANDNPAFFSLFGDVYAAIQGASLSELFALNSAQGIYAKWMFFVESGRGLQLIGLFIIGLVLGRIGFFTQPEKFERSRVTALGIALLASAVLYWLDKSVQELPATTFQESAMAKWYITQALGTYLSSAITASLVLLFIQCYYWRPTGRYLNLLAPCGQISLTIYLLQSVIGVPLFYPFGLGWYETIGQTNSLLFGIVFYAVLMCMAQAWVKRFYYGPVEWLWRSATYMTTAVPLIKRAH
jgi:uncharacterized protein